MNYAYFPGCKIPYFLPSYDRSTRALLGPLGVGLVEMEFGCCGYPAREMDPMAFLFSAARNLALAQEQGLDILTPCKCCFGNLRKAVSLLAQDNAPSSKVRQMLAAEGLAWEGSIRVRHLLQVLDQDLEPQALASALKRPLEGLRVAVHYGCHALRPQEVTGLDIAAAPTIFERLVEAAGVTCLDYAQRLECCGQPLAQRNLSLSRALMTRKLEGARQAGAQLIVSACTYCQMQFDGAQELAGGGGDPPLPSVLVSQLLGLGLGASARELGLLDHRIQPGPLEQFMG